MSEVLKKEGENMLCKEIIREIEKTYPETYAMNWDNVGLLVGRDDREVKNIYVALDATDEVIEEAIRQGADMLVTHHPLIFGGMKRINNQDFIGRRILTLIEHDISYYAMHTNYDVLGMAELSGKMLGLENAQALEVTAVTEEGREEGIGRVGKLPKTVTLQEVCRLVKERFCLETVKVFGNPDQKIIRVAISPGSGKSMIQEALKQEAEVLITGDIDHHAGIDAVAQNLAVIDAGHYGLEFIFMEDMKAYLQGVLQGVEVVSASVVHPFQTI